MSVCLSPLFVSPLFWLSPLGLPLGDSSPLVREGVWGVGGVEGVEGGEGGEGIKCVHRREKQPLGCFDSRLHIFDDWPGLRWGTRSTRCWCWARYWGCQARGSSCHCCPQDNFSAPGAPVNIIHQFGCQLIESLWFADFCKKCAAIIDHICNHNTTAATNIIGPPKINQIICYTWTWDFDFLTLLTCLLSLLSSDCWEV